MDIECKSRSRWGKEARFDKLQEPATMMMNDVEVDGGDDGEEYGDVA